MATQTKLDRTMVPKVHSIIQKYGKLVTFQRSLSGAYDPLTGTTAQGTTASYQVKVTPPSGEVQRREEGSGNLPVVLTRIYLPAKDLTFTPTKDMTVIVDGTTFRITQIEPVYTGELIALYGLTIEK